jgi:hypothetical protein
MKVKIGDKIYDSREEPILLILSEEDKRNLERMDTEATKFLSFPDKMDLNEAKRFMKID